MAKVTGGDKSTGDYSTPSNSVGMIQVETVYDPGEQETDDISVTNYVNPISHQTSACCQRKSTSTFLIIVVAVLYFVGVGINGVALKLLINERIAGHAEHPDSNSAFVDTTTTFLRSVSSFIMGRYTSGLGDYIGRKPLLIVASVSLIFSRLTYYFAYTPAAFFTGGIVGGAFDCFYFTALAWVCDLYPIGIRRSKRVGIFTGAVGGIAFVIGVPLGAILAVKVGLRLPFLITMVLGAMCIVFLVVMPVDDTIGVRSDPSTARHLVSTRYFPVHMKLFMIDNFPLSIGSVGLMRLASHPLDWVANFLLHICSSTAFVVFIQFSLSVYGFSGPITAVMLISIGIGLAITAPVLLGRYHSIPVVFYTGMVFSTGLLLLAISGMGVNQQSARMIAIPGIVTTAVGVSWSPAYQSIITSQYDSSSQGIVSGMLNQQNDLAIFPAYLISLLFSFSLKENAVIPWPGSAFAVAAILGYFACAIHYCSYGQQALVLTRRKGKFSLSSTVSDVAAASNDGRSERGVETNTRVGIADNMPL